MGKPPPQPPQQQQQQQQRQPRALSSAASPLRRGRFSRAELWAWRAVYLAGFLLLVAHRKRCDRAIESLWAYLNRKGWAQIDSFEPIVASIAFFIEIGVWKLVDLLGQRALRRYKIDPAHDPIKEEGGAFEFFSPVGTKDKPGFIALFFYLSPLIVFDILFPRRTERAYFHLPPPTALQLMANLALSLFTYDLLYYFPHLLMHRNVSLFRMIHSKHHRMNRLCAVEVVRHTLWDGILQVGANIITLNFLGLDAFTRAAHNIAVTYMLTEIHSGYDFPWMIHNILPRGVLAGSPVHEAHHRDGTASYHQFFTYFDKLFGLEYEEVDGVLNTRGRHCDNIHNNIEMIRTFNNSGPETNANKLQFQKVK